MVIKLTAMGIYITSKLTRNKEKKWYTFEWGKNSNERKAAGIFTYVTCKNMVQKNHNKEALALLETKKSQLTLERQSIGTPYIPTHRFKANFIDYYSEFVKNNKKKGNRHLEGSLSQFKNFVKKEYVPPLDITENLCIRYRKHLMGKLTGKSPSDYFLAFKRVVKAATKEGYFRLNPADDVKAKTNPSRSIKEFLEADEYISLLKTPIRNGEIRDAFVVSCYSGLRWCDIKLLEWGDIGEESITTRIIQQKTGKPVVLTLHPIVKSILHKRMERLGSNKCRGGVFNIGTANGCNKALKNWMRLAGIKKHITWHCARLSFSILLQDANVDTATVALLLGHTTTRYVNEIYKRHRPKDQLMHLTKLPQAVLAN